MKKVAARMLIGALLAVAIPPAGLWILFWFVSSFDGAILKEVIRFAPMQMVMGAIAGLLFKEE